MKTIFFSRLKSNDLSISPHGQKTQAEWRNVFYVCGGFTLFGAIVFGGFAKTDTEPWARDPDDNTDKELEVTSEDATGNGSYVNKGLDARDANPDDLAKAKV